MSANSSVTIRSDSQEPPAKRQKTLDHDFDIILLEVPKDGTDNIELAAVAFPNKLFQVYPHTSRVENWSGSSSPDGARVGKLELNHKASVVKFLSYWAHKRNAKAALQGCLPPEHCEKEFLCHVLHFCHEEKIHHDVHDAVVDCMIEHIQGQRQLNSTPRDVIDNLFYAQEKIEEEFEILTSAEVPKLIELLAVLHIHHLRSDIPNNVRDSFDETKYPGLIDDIGSHAHVIMHRVFDEGTFANIPEDPLADDFDEHCRYHKHRDSETCYKLKQL